MTNRVGNPRLAALLERCPALEACGDSLHAALEALAATFVQGGKLLVCGNGGSAADAEHMVGELMKAFLLPRPISAAHRACLEAADGGRDLALALQGALPALALTAHGALAT